MCTGRPQAAAVGPAAQMGLDLDLDLDLAAEGVACGKDDACRSPEDAGAAEGRRCAPLPAVGALPFAGLAFGAALGAGGGLLAASLVEHDVSKSSGPLLVGGRRGGAGVSGAPEP